MISLGCPKNRVDTELMLGVTDQEGYILIDDPSRADVIVVNTCGFIDAAKKESIDTILQMGQYKAHGRCEKLVVTGCLSQRYPDELAESLPEVDHFLGSSDMLKLRDVLDSDAHASRMMVGNPADYVQRVSDVRVLSSALFSVYIKIAEGCSRKCSFCAIPSFRGTQRSRPLDDVVAEAERFVARGTVELNIISQDTVSYGRDLADGTTLASLVQKLGDINGLRWIRLFYLYPDKLSDEAIDLLAHHPKVVPYVDMPLQHASDVMLKRMRRGYSGIRLRRVVERLRERIPNLTFRTAFIVGHPGETDADFNKLCEFVGWAEFDHVGAFLYSHEESTHSGTMTDLVPVNVANARYRRLMSLQKKISRRKLKTMVGKEIEVLVEGVSQESDFLLEGRHKGQAPDIDGKVILTNGEAQPGEIRRAIVSAASDYDLIADLADEFGRVERPVQTTFRPSRKKALPILASRG